MNTIEQQLWDYIDGNLDESQQKAIEKKIETEAEVKTQYEELLKLNLAFEHIDLDEPSMSFTRNVMESVVLQPAPVSLKTKVDKRIIYSISGFFILSILTLLSFVLYNTTFTMPDFTAYFSTNLNLEKFITPTSVYVFLFIDLIIGLVFLDYVLRKKLIRREG